MPADIERMNNKKRIMKKDNNKLKKIGAWTAIIILLLACCMPMFFAFGKGENSQNYFKASLAVAIMVPLLAYAMWLVYRILNKNKKAVDSISFSIHKGQILGIAAVEGNGQNEVAELITGLRKPSAGSIKLAGEQLVGKSIRQIRDAGVANVAEDRMSEGCATSISIRENLVSDRYSSKRFCNGIFVKRKEVIKEATLKKSRFRKIP